jgi:hypothetical protein
MARPLKGTYARLHWRVPEICDWPKADGMAWLNLKKVGIQQRLMALAKRGKGPLARGLYIALSTILVISI